MAASAVRGNINLSMPPLRVCIDARLATGPQSGVASVLIGLANGLSALVDGDEQYLFLVYRDSYKWLEPYLKGPCQLLLGPVAPRTPRWQIEAKRIPGLYRAWHYLSHPNGLTASDGIIENASIEIMHFSMPMGFLTRVPSIYQPYDLQHLFFPGFFTRRQWRQREVQYRAFCNQAKMVFAMSVSGKRDLVYHYGIPEKKVAVVPLAPVLEAYPIPSQADLEAVGRKFDLPPRFIFYPAQTWEHKNHLGLLEALGALRVRYGAVVPLVCSGYQNQFFAVIQKRVRALRLERQVTFLGYVSDIELQALYRLSRGLVFPSKFEGWGLPLMEAFLAGTPAACSNVSPLAEQSDGAALLFNPDQPAEIAATVYRLWTDEGLRQRLIELAKTRVALFKWSRTATLFRAHYRRLAARELTQEDRAMLNEPPLV